MNIYEKLSFIQNELKAPKGQYNSFGRYKYRSCEDILEALKPICKKYKTVLVVEDEVELISNRFYIKAIATLYDTEKEESTIRANAYAREDEVKKGMDSSQLTGATSSYARKYALNGLFNIDDTKDADTDEFTKKVSNANTSVNSTVANRSHEKTKEELLKELNQFYNKHRLYFNKYIKGLLNGRQPKDLNEKELKDIMTLIENSQAQISQLEDRG